MSGEGKEGKWEENYKIGMEKFKEREKERAARSAEMRGRRLQVYLKAQRTGFIESWVEFDAWCNEMRELFSE